MHSAAPQKMDALHDALQAHLRSVAADPRVLSGFAGDKQLFADTQNYVLTHWFETKHMLSLDDQEYVRMITDMRGIGHRWKGRARDFKGQYFKTRVEDGVIQGWSSRQHRYVLVMPWAFGAVLKSFFDEFNKAVATVNPAKKARLDAYNEELERDYESTAGQRAETRSLNERPHRRSLNGRRNHFVSVPKTV